MTTQKNLQINIGINIHSKDFNFFGNTFFYNKINIKDSSFIINETENINRIISIFLPQMSQPTNNIFYSSNSESIKTTKTTYVIDKTLHIYFLKFIPPIQETKILNSTTELYKELINFNFTNDFTKNDLKKYIESRLNLEKDIIEKTTQNKLQSLIQKDLSIKGYFDFLENEKIIQ